MRMPLFFLHIWDGERLIRDPDGSFHDDLEGARSEAIESARALMAANILDEGRIGIERSMTICDASGTALLVLPFHEATLDAAAGITLTVLSGLPGRLFPTAGELQARRRAESIILDVRREIASKCLRRAEECEAALAASDPSADA